MFNYPDREPVQIPIAARQRTGHAEQHPLLKRYEVADRRCNTSLYWFSFSIHRSKDYNHCFGRELPPRQSRKSNST